MFGFVLRWYAVLMCMTGIISVLVDGWLFSIGAITRRLNIRAALMMGVFWPIFLFLLGYMLWKTRDKLSG